jgi:hypothetical protein
MSDEDLKAELERLRKYKEQWLKLLDMSADIRAFIAANEAQLKSKD